MKTKFYLGFLVALVMTSCGKDPQLDTAIVQSGDGELKLSLGTTGVFEAINTYAGEVSVDDFNVKLSGTSLAGENQSMYWAKYSDMPSIVTVPAGVYSIEAYNGTQSSGFEMPYYYGAKAFSVGIQEMSNVSLVCKLACVKVSVDFTSLFKSKVDGGVCKISTIDAQGHSNVLEFSDTETRDGYIAIPSDSVLTVTITGHYHEDGSVLEITKIIKSVKTADWHKIKLSVNSSAAIKNDPGFITIDYTINEVKQDLLIPGANGVIDNNGDTGSWGDDTTTTPVVPPTPIVTDTVDIIGTSFNGSAFDMADTIFLTESQVVSSLDVTIKASAGIKNLYLVMKSTDITALNPIFAALGTTDDSNPIDLANPGNLASPASGSWQETFLAVGVLDSSDPILGKTNYVFSVGSFMSMLTTPNTVGDSYYHSFKIKVVDNNDNSKQSTLMICKTK